VAAAVKAQSQPNETLPGFKAENVLEARGIDNVNPFSGDPGVVLPLGPEYPLSSAVSWQLKAHYSVKFWNFPDPCPSDSTFHFAYVGGDPTLGVGWSLQLGYVVQPLVNYPYVAYYFSPDGGRHGVAFDASGTGITDDGSHLRIKRYQTPNYFTVEFPNGTKEFFEQPFLPPTPASASPPQYGKDFTNLVGYHETPALRYGLTKIQDRFDTIVLKAKYDNPSPSQPTRVILNPDANDNGPTVSIHWSQTGQPSVSWWVADYVLFPGVGSQQRRVDFGYQFLSFARNPYDISHLNTNPNHPCAADALPSTVPYAPMLHIATFRDGNGSSFAPFSYTFDYSDYPGTGELLKITLPTSGTVAYTYAATTGTLCELPSCDPESSTGGSGTAVQTQAIETFPANIQPFKDYLDKSLAIQSRVQTDPTTNTAATTNYGRVLIIQCTDSQCTAGLDNKLYRRVDVTEPANDSVGPPQFVSRSYFAVAPPDSDNVIASGEEVDHRQYSGATPSSTSLLRTLIRCYDHTTTLCGYRDSSGGIQNADHLIEPPAAEITWYGAVPSGSDGGFCVAASTACTGVNNANYDPTVGRYPINTLTSRLPGAPTGWTRQTTTTFNPQTGSKWMLDIISAKRVTENPAPAPNDITTNSNFDLTTGFLASSSVTDGANGTRTDAFGHDPGVWDPKTETVSLGMSSFTDTRAFQHGLILSSQRTTPAGIAWRSFDVSRDPATGLITSSRTPYVSPQPVLQTSYSYDALGRLTSLTPPGGDVPTGVCYDSTIQTTTYRASSVLSCPVDPTSGLALTWLQYRYDSLGRLIREIRQMPVGSASNFAFRVHRYDTAGHPSFISEWGGCGPTPNDCGNANSPLGTTSSNFDAFGRAQQVTKADNTITTIDFTDDGVAPSIASSDSLRKVTVSVNGATSTTTTRKDALGRIVKVTEPNLPGQTTPDDTAYTYNVLDKLVTVSQGSQARTFVYDAFGFLRSEATPEKGSVTYSSYDALGNAVTETQNDGTLVNRVFDAAGRLQKTTAGGSVYQRNCYDGASVACVDGVANGGGGTNPSGKLTRQYGYNPVSTPTLTVTEDFSYNNAAGRLSGQTTSFDSGSLAPASQAWSYNALGLLNQHAHYRVSGAPFTVRTTYSQALPIAEYVNGIPVVSTVTYAPSGALSGYTTGLGIGSNIATAIAQDPTGIPRPYRISSQIPGPNPVLFDTGTYSYDGAGNILAMTRSALNLDSFKYDSRSRLCSASLYGAGNQYYAYDRYGNLTSKTFTNPGTCTSSAWSNNRVPTATYGGNPGLRGDMTLYGGTSYTYDGLDRLTSAGGSTYFFDASNERVVKYNGLRTYTLRDEGKRVGVEFTDAGSQSRDNVFLGSLLVASYSNPGVTGNGPIWTFYASDHLGTPRLITGISGAAVENRQSWSYGEDVGSPSLFERVRFASMERDTESPSYYDHARNEEFNLGRFLAADLAQGGVTNPQSWNRYSYVFNDPLRFLDPDGLDIHDPQKACNEALGHPCDDTQTVVNASYDQMSVSNQAKERMAVRSLFDLIRGRNMLLTPSQILFARPDAPEYRSPDWKSPALSPCKESFGARWQRSFDESHEVTSAGLIGAAEKAADVVTEDLTGEVYAAPSLLKWATNGFRGMRMGASEFTAMETGVTATATSATHALYFAASFEFGMALGSAVNVSLVQPCVE
jgi:RHS repeat-associated protein